MNRKRQYYRRCICGMFLIWGCKYCSICAEEKEEAFIRRNPLSGNLTQESIEWLRDDIGYKDIINNLKEN